MLLQLKKLRQNVLTAQYSVACRKTLWFAAGLLVLLANTVVASPRSEVVVNQHMKVHPQSHKRASLLFLQQAERASLRVLKNNKHCYQLTLSGIRQGVLYFSNQPRRVVGRINNKRFIDIWKHNGIQPNIVLQGYYKRDDESSEFNKVLVISNPQYKAKSDRISYHVCLLNNRQPEMKDTNMFNVTLFIDNFHPWP